MEFLEKQESGQKKSKLYHKEHQEVPQEAR